MQDSLNAAINAVKDSVEEKGDKIAEEVKKGNDQDNEFQDWVKGDGRTPEQIAGSVEVPYIDLSNSIPGLNGTLISYADHCPDDRALTLYMGQLTKTYTFSFSKWCDGLMFIGLIVQVFAYLHAGYIVIGAIRG